MLDSIKKKDEPIFDAPNARWWCGFLLFSLIFVSSIVGSANALVEIGTVGIFVGILPFLFSGYMMNRYIRNRKARKRWMKIHEEMKEIENQLT